MLEGMAALLIDLDGVLYVEEELVPGALEAVNRLRDRGLAQDAHARDQAGCPGRPV
jgi:ribonucleotide monophosphatase NagD (HAD superfamily)